LPSGPSFRYAARALYPSSPGINGTKLYAPRRRLIKLNCGADDHRTPASSRLKAGPARAVQKLPSGAPCSRTIYGPLQEIPILLTRMPITVATSTCASSCKITVAIQALRYPASPEFIRVRAFQPLSIDHGPVPHYCHSNRLPYLPSIHFGNILFGTYADLE
jgi:hypothetical protein